MRCCVAADVCAAGQIFRGGIRAPPRVRHSKRCTCSSSCSGGGCCPHRPQSKRGQALEQKIGGGGMRRVIYSSSDSTHLPPHPTMCACEWRPRLPLSLVYNLLVSNKTTKCRRRRRRRRVSLLFFMIAQPLVYDRTAFGLSFGLSSHRRRGGHELGEATKHAL